MALLSLNLEACSEAFALTSLAEAFLSDSLTDINDSWASAALAVADDAWVVAALALALALSALSLDANAHDRELCVLPVSLSVSIAPSGDVSDTAQF